MIIDEIEKSITWINNNSKSTDIASLSTATTKMSGDCYFFSKMVSDAYELMSTTEDEYKAAKAAYIRDSKDGITKAKEIVDCDEEVAKLKKIATDANNLHNRYRRYAAAFDTVLDCARQKISVYKTLDAKNI